ncbi:Hypothetical protein FKW44_018791 [Caligus rogercresseyi]|uniref:Uncharacterized protein n=1 Tax=Caligus rogercresseyi TaxID=217165 RepID=A0A7T8GUY7_CALRO|nr:Hypothetical protein FKW44_018791 [Caligus rogercresseyi]
MSLCCEIGVPGGVFLSEFPSRGTFPVPLCRPIVKNPPRKAHKDPVTAEVCTL